MVARAWHIPDLAKKQSPVRAVSIPARPFSSAHAQTPMPKRDDIESILIIGAGPIVIGQACEFD